MEGIRIFFVVFVCACAVFVDAGIEVPSDPTPSCPEPKFQYCFKSTFTRWRNYSVYAYRLWWEAWKCKRAQTSGGTYSIPENLDLDAIKQQIETHRACCSYRWFMSLETRMLDTIETLRTCAASFIPTPAPAVCGGTGESCLFSTEAVCTGAGGIVTTDKVCADSSKVCCLIGF